MVDRGRGADAVDAMHDLTLKVLRRTPRRDDGRVHVRRQKRRLEAAGHGVTSARLADVKAAPIHAHSRRPKGPKTQRAIQKANTQEARPRAPFAGNADARPEKNQALLPHLLLDRRAPDLLDALHAGPHVGLHPPPPLVVRAARRLAAPDAAPPRGLLPREGREAVLEHGHLALGLAAVGRAPRPS